VLRNCFELLKVTEAMLSGCLSPWHGESSGCGRGHGLYTHLVVANIWTSSHGQPTSGGTPALGLGTGANNSPQKSSMLGNITKGLGLVNTITDFRLP